MVWLNKGLQHVRLGCENLGVVNERCRVRRPFGPVGDHDVRQGEENDLDQLSADSLQAPRQLPHLSRCEQHQTHIVGARRLQLGGLAKELLQQREEAVSLQGAGQARQQLQVQLNVAPLALSHLGLNAARQLRQQHVDDLGLARVGHQHDGGEEGRLERLLERQLHHQVDKVPAQQLVVPVVGEQVRDRRHLLVPGADGVLGDGQQLSADALVWGRRVDATVLVAASSVVVVVVCSRAGRWSAPSSHPARSMKPSQQLVAYLSGTVASWNILLHHRRRRWAGTYHRGRSRPLRLAVTR